MNTSLEETSVASSQKIWKEKAKPLYEQNDIDDHRIDVDTNSTREICGVLADGLSRLSSIRFNVANVAKPLASAVKVAEVGNIIVMHPHPEKCFIQNIETGERMRLRKDRGTYVFDVIYEDNGEQGKVTLDSGAGVSVWPKDLLKKVKLEPKQKGLRMVAANGTEIKNEGQKVIKFRGVIDSEPKIDDPTFGGPK